MREHAWNGGRADRSGPRSSRSICSTLKLVRQPDDKSTWKISLPIDAYPVIRWPRSGIGNQSAARLEVRMRCRSNDCYFFRYRRCSPERATTKRGRFGSKRVFKGTISRRFGFCFRAKSTPMRARKRSARVYRKDHAKINSCVKALFGDYAAL